MKNTFEVLNIDKLSLEEAKEYYTSLTNYIKSLNKSYYIDNDPQVEDAEYDEIFAIYNNLITKFPDIQGDKKEDLLGSSVKETGFKKVNHMYRMLSLDNLFTQEDVINFDKRIKSFLMIEEQALIEYSAEVKIDGLSLSLVYEKGKLSYAATRGDGQIGEDVTENVKTIASIPQEINSDLERLEIRGEVFINKNSFLEFNQSQERQGKKTFANPRNMASGSLRSLDVNVTKERPLDFIAWGLIGSINNNNKLSDNFTEISKLGFNINTYNRVCKGVNELLSFFEDINEQRASIPYDIDGVVYKVNSISQQERLGNLLRSPRWASSHKFTAQTAITKIIDIVTQVGRVGTITPVANLSPVNIGGVTVSRASLHNIDEIQRKDIRKNDTVVIKRAGDIIPQVEKVIIEQRPLDSVEFKMPTHCPCCGSELIQNPGEVAIKCSGAKFFCSAQKLESFKHFVSKPAFDIKSLGEKQLELFINKNYIKYPSDLWDLQNHIDEIKVLEGFGDKSTNNLISSINSISTISLSRLIYSLGIPSVGVKNSELLAAEYKNIEAFKEFAISKDTSFNIYGLGESVLNEIKEFFSNSLNIEILSNLQKKVAIEDYKNEEIDTNSYFANKKVLFTGSLSQFSRAEIQELAKRNGAIIVSAVSSKLDYLIVGSSPGSKLKKAQELSIKVITEDEFLGLIKQPKVD